MAGPDDSIGVKPRRFDLGPTAKVTVMVVVVMMMMMMRRRRSRSRRRRRRLISTDLAN